MQNPEPYYEYIKLGETLKTLTVTDIANKFDISPSSVKAIINIDLEDIPLIKTLYKERQDMLKRRSELRGQLHKEKLYSIIRYLKRLDKSTQLT